MTGAALRDILGDSRDAKCCILQYKIVSKIGPGRSPKRRVRDSSHNLLQLETRTNASFEGASTVMCVDDGTREATPNPVALNVMNQANFYQQFQRNEYTVRLCRLYK